MITENNSKRIAEALDENRELSTRDIAKDTDLNPKNASVATLSRFINDKMGYRSMIKAKTFQLTEMQIQNRY